MAFTEKLPEWQAEGIEPPDSKKQAGWEVEDKPPAGWWNWILNRTFKSLEELRSKAVEKQYVDDAVNGLKVPDASLVPFGGLTTNSGNDYSIAAPKIQALTKGMAVSVQINIDSTGDASLNWDGKGAKPIKKANGSNVTNLKANGIYTFRYDGSSFILQGEGGDYGTVTAADVRSTKTFGTDDGPKPGTLVTQATQAQTITPGVSNIVKPAGIYDGAITILGDVDLVASNFPKDVNIFGIQGILERLTTADRDAIIAAIVSKGVAASASDSNAALAMKIQQINQGSRYDFSIDRNVPGSSTDIIDNNFTIATIPYGKSMIVVPTVSNGFRARGNFTTYNSGTVSRMALRDSSDPTHYDLLSGFNSSTNGGVTTTDQSITFLEVDCLNRRYRMGTSSGGGTVGGYVNFPSTWAAQSDIILEHRVRLVGKNTSEYGTLILTGIGMVV